MGRSTRAITPSLPPPPPSRPERRARVRLRPLAQALSASALLAGLLLVHPGNASAQSAVAPATVPGAPPGQSAPPTVSVDQIMKSPGSYFGAPVQIVGDVSQAVGQHAFTL